MVTYACTSCNKDTEIDSSQLLPSQKEMRLIPTPAGALQQGGSPLSYGFICPACRLIS